MLSAVTSRFGRLAVCHVRQVGASTVQQVSRQEAVAGPSRITPMASRYFSASPISQATMNQGEPRFRKVHSRAMLNAQFNGFHLQWPGDAERRSEGYPRPRCWKHATRKKPSSPKYTRRNRGSRTRLCGKFVESSFRRGTRLLHISLVKDTTCRNIVWCWSGVGGQRICPVFGGFSSFLGECHDADTEFFVLCSYKLVRGAQDFGGVASRTKSRSKYGSKFHDRVGFASRKLTSLRSLR